MTTTTRTDLTGRTVRTPDGPMLVTGHGERDCGDDDARTGTPIVYGLVRDHAAGVAYESWAYLDEVTIR